MTIAIAPISLDDAESFHQCLDSVARERKYLALLEAPPLDVVRGFVTENIANGVPQTVARQQDTVVGWCDIFPARHETLRHSGSLGMGVLPAFRGLGLGRRLLAATIELAKTAGITRVELEVRSDNLVAIGLYEHAGFRAEGLKRHGMRVDSLYHDVVLMAILLDQ